MLWTSWSRSRPLGERQGDGAQGRNRTTDTVIFSHVLYQLSYLGAGPPPRPTQSDGVYSNKNKDCPVSARGAAHEGIAPKVALTWAHQSARSHCKSDDRSLRRGAEMSAVGEAQTAGATPPGRFPRVLSTRDAREKRIPPALLGACRFFTRLSTTTERSVVLGLDRVRLVALVGRNRVAAREPSAEVDIGAPARTKRPESLVRRPAADRTRLCLVTLHGIAHAPNIGTARLKEKGPLAAGVGESRLGRPCGIAVRPAVARTYGGNDATGSALDQERLPAMPRSTQEGQTSTWPPIGPEEIRASTGHGIIRRRSSSRNALGIPRLRAAPMSQTRAAQQRLNTTRRF